MYHDTSMGGGFYNGNNTGTPSKAKGNNQNRMQCLLPVCIRQLLSVPNDEFVLFGTRGQIVSVVGILREYDVSSIKATYTIEDHTGTIKGALWLDSEANESLGNLPPVKEGRYLKVFGSLRVNNNEKTLLILKMLPVEDPNVITTHLLEVIHARYATEKLLQEGTIKTTANNPGASLANTMSHMYENPELGNGSCFTPLQQKVHDIFKADNCVNGMHIGVLRSNFKNNQHHEVQKAIELLVNEGHIYTTIDNEHYKSTD